MKKVKLYVCLQIVMILAVAMSIQGVYAASNNQINIQVKTESQVKNVAVNDSMGYPFIDKNSRTLCPLRTVADSLGMQVEWDANDRSASFTIDQNMSTIYEDNIRIVEKVTFKIGSKQYLKTKKNYYNGVLQDNMVSEILSMDTEPVIVGGRTYAPVRYLAEAFGYNVDWEAYSKTVVVNAKDSWIAKELINTGYKQSELQSGDIKKDDNNATKDDNKGTVSETLPVALTIKSDIPESTYDESIVISGVIENCNDNVVLRCNNKAIKYDNDGYFKVEYTLEDGDNTIAFKLLENDEIKTIKSYRIERIVDYYYEFNDTGITITSYNGKERDVVIPSQIDGFDVTALASGSFGATNITSVIVPETVSTMYPSTFYKCSLLKKLIIKGSNIILSGDGSGDSFSSCSSLEEIRFTGDNIKLGGAVFWHNGNLKNVTFEGENCTLGNNIFMYCDNLDTVTLSGDGFCVGYGAFYRSSMKNLILCGKNGSYSMYMYQNSKADNEEISDDARVM